MLGKVIVQLKDTMSPTEVTYEHAFIEIGNDGVLVIQGHTGTIAVFNQSQWKAAWLESLI
jgi:hypothetical protein